jgi:hypothetical protein
MNGEVHRGAQRRSIKRLIQRKLEEWYATLPSWLADLARKDTVVSGGCIVSMLLGERIKDFDIYFETMATTEAVAKHYVDRWIAEHPEDENARTRPPEVRIYDTPRANGTQETRVGIFIKSAGAVGEEIDTAGYEYFEGDRTGERAGEYLGVEGEALEPDIDNPEQMVEALERAEGDKKPPYRPVFMSQNAISLSDKMQIVIRFYGEPDKIHENYDFVHATSYYRSQTNELVLRDKAMEAILSRTLYYTGSLYPLCSMFRMKKFLDRGWRISAGEMLKIAWQINELNLKDFNVLREQLTGVDAAYFHQLLRLLKEGKKVNEDGKVDVGSSYIATLIDRIYEL